MISEGGERKGEEKPIGHHKTMKKLEVGVKEHNRDWWGK
jgi:hypothetical protein